MARGGFRWNVNTLETGLDQLNPRLHEAISTVVKRGATQGETYMRKNAPWTDRTTNARNGLRAIPTHTPAQHTVLLTHSMHYGIWLEVRWSGKYGILPQSIRYTGNEIMRMLNKLMARL